MAGFASTNVPFVRRPTPLSVAAVELVDLRLGEFGVLADVLVGGLEVRQLLRDVLHDVTAGAPPHREGPGRGTRPA